MGWEFAAVTVIALAGFGFAATAVALGIKVGKQLAAAGELKVELGKANDSVDKSDVRIGELEQIIESRGERISSLYDELSTCGDAESRARVAVDGIKLMLPTWEDDYDATGGGAVKLPREPTSDPTGS